MLAHEVVSLPESSTALACSNPLSMMVWISFSVSATLKIATWVFLHIPPKRYIPGITRELLTHIGHFSEVQREKMIMIIEAVMP